MTHATREMIEQLVNDAWELHDKANTVEEKEHFKLEIMDLISRLPENEIYLHTIQ